jgi:ATP-dependent RNA helicase DDX51/DBP6
VLSKRIVTRLRALIILPTRDLVSQVKETFESVAKGTGLKVSSLIHLPSHKSISWRTPRRLTSLANFSPFFSFRQIATVTGSQSFAAEQANLVHPSSSSVGGRTSMVDILICTPGRLIDHLNGTPGFSLEFLRFLVSFTYLYTYRSHFVVAADLRLSVRAWV